VKFDFKRSAFAAVLLAGVGSTAAYATDGYFMNGYGASQTALAGAGVAYSQDAMAISLNPAGLVNVDDQTVAGMAIFMPFRSYSAGANGSVTCSAAAPCDAVAPGTHNSGNNWFPVPDFAWTKHLGQDTVLGIGLYGNGGMDTRYSNTVFPFPGSYGPTGVDVNQAFMSVSLAQRFGQFSVGVAPVLAMQTFNAFGLKGFAPFSSDGTNLSNNSYAFSYGGGVRAGLEYDVSSSLRLAVAGTSRIYMTNFDIYKGLFAGGGNFDIPASITAGVSYDVRPNVTVMADYKHIFYGDVASISNPSTNQTAFGSSNGPGFGWHDINVYKFGVDWRYNPAWTLRAGYSYNDSPLNSRDIMLNILAPATVQHHFTGGFKYKWSERLDLEFSAMYAPEGTLKGTGTLIPYGGGTFGGQPIQISMHEIETMMGITYHWNGRQELEPLK
jgi:long-chain fatty acid transport protein